MTAFVAIALSSFIAAPIPNDVLVKTSHEAIQGEWKFVEVCRNGNETKELENATMIIKGNEITINGYTSKPEVFTLTLDPKANPSTIDMKYANRDAVAKGIYKLEKDKLTICLDFDESKRPKEFKSEQDSRTGLFVLERVKK